MNEVSDKVLKMLAAKEGEPLVLEHCEDRHFGKFRLKRAEAIQALNQLVSDGMVATIYERLDGPMFALSEEGRKMMAERGFNFDGVSVEKTRKLFREWLCKTSL